jgi:hypothetical protein
MSVSTTHLRPSPGLINEDLQRASCTYLIGRNPEAARQHVGLKDRLDHRLDGRLHDAVADRRDDGFIVLLLSVGAGFGDPGGRGDAIAAGLLDVVGEGDGPAARGVAAGGQVAALEPVVDDVGADAEVVGDGGDGQLAGAARWCSGVVAGQLAGAGDAIAAGLLDVVGEGDGPSAVVAAAVTTWLG